MTAIRIPGVIDMLTISDPATIRALADNPDLDRVEDGGPLLVRFLRRRMAGALRTADGPLPSALPRASAERQAMRKALSARLADPGLDARLARAVSDAGAFVAGGDGAAFVAGGDGPAFVARDDGAAGPLAQTLFGRVFVEGFAATPATWEAAVILGRAVGPPSLRSTVDALTARVGGAQSTLSRAMAGDRNGVHAIGVAVHNFAETLARMRALDKGTPKAKALANVLLAPARVARQGVSVAETVGGQVRPGTMVVLNTRDAADQSLDPRVGFLTEAWSGCPAHAFVPKLAARIWDEAGGAP